MFPALTIAGALGEARRMLRSLSPKTVVYALVGGFMAFLWVSLYGFHLGPVDIEGAKAKAARFEAQYETVLENGRKALKAQIEQTKRAEAAAKDLAKETDDETDRLLADGADRTDRFIAGNRLHEGGRCPSVPGASASDRGAKDADRSGGAAQLAPGVDAVSDPVVVPAEDLRICSRNTIRLQQAREWGLQLNDTMQGASDGQGDHPRQ